MLYKFLPVTLFVIELGTVCSVFAVASAQVQGLEVEQVVAPLERREVRLVVVPSTQPTVAVETVPAVVTMESVVVEELLEEPVKVKRKEEEVFDGEVLLAKLMSDSAADSVEAIKASKQRPSSGRVPAVPFYSQFNDISSPSWQKVGCGIASLSMIIDYYSDEAVSVDALLDRGIKAGAYISSAGWSHAGLIGLSRSYGLGGESVSMSDLSMSDAFSKLEKVLEDGPVMVSVHYTFEPTNPIPHLVVVNGVLDGKVIYNDPAEPTGAGSISIEKFQSAWKKRYISIRPV